MSPPVLANPKDPLRGVGPQAGRELFEAMSRLASGHAQQDVIDAATSMLINLIRQKHASRSLAEAEFDELLGRSKSLLMQHYDGMTGRRRPTFAFPQFINVKSVVR